MPRIKKLEKIVRKFDVPNKRICDSARDISKILDAKYGTIYTYLLAKRHNFKSAWEYRQYLEEKKEETEKNKTLNYETIVPINEKQEEFENEMIVLLQLNDREKDIPNLIDNSYEEIIDSIDIDKLFEKLLIKEREVIFWGVIMRETLEDRGKRLGLTTERVRQIENKALIKLRKRAQFLGINPNDYNLY